MGAIAIGLVACNNEEVVIDPNAPESTVSVRIAPSSESTVRSIGDLSSDGILAPGLANESDIKNLEVYVFSGDTPDGYKAATSSTTVTQVLDIATHSGPRTIIVVANAGIGAVANKTALLAKTKDLPVTAGALVMTSGETSVTLEKGDNQYGFSTTTSNYKATAKQHSVDTPLKIKRINARVAIVSAKLQLDADQLAIFDNLQDIQVAMFNVPTTSKLFGASLVTTTPTFLFGEAWPSTATSYTTGTAESTFKNTKTGTFEDGDDIFTNASAAYYYVNENTSEVAKERTMIVLRAKPYKGATALDQKGIYIDDSGYTYFPIWVNASDKSYTYGGSYTATNNITRNTQYNISLTIKKIGNPSIDPIEVSKLDVQVEVLPWTVVTQTVTW